VLEPTNTQQEEEVTTVVEQEVPATARGRKPKAAAPTVAIQPSARFKKDTYGEAAVTGYAKLPTSTLRAQIGVSWGTLNELGWNQGPVPGRHMIRGLGAPALLLEDIEPTAELLSQVFGLVQIDQTGPRYRFSAGKGPGGRVDVEVRPHEQHGRGGAGTVHHIAFRAPDNVDQIEWREILVERGLEVTPVKDRLYFQSIYFREPGGILFEIATDTPGFTVDEPRESLGSHLMLPAWFEPQRVEIERALPEINVHPGQLI